MATIYCFSSTGNSLYAAKRIAGEIGGNVLPMRKESSVCDDDVIGFVFPTYFLGLPRAVESFIKELRISRKDAYIFAVITCGSVANGVPGVLQKLLKSKGVSLKYVSGLVFLSNYIPEYKINDTEEKRVKTELNLSRIIGELKERHTKKISTFTLFNDVYYKFYPDQNSDTHFTVSSKCNGCGTCQKVCPVDNIILEGGRPRFLHKCENCIGCLHHCPTQAIDWKNKTNGKKRYRHSKISLNELITFVK